jgi:hypothetical protein
MKNVLGHYTVISMMTPEFKTLLNRKQVLQEELDQLVHCRSLLKSDAERLKQTPDLVRIFRAMSEVEQEIEKHKQWQAQRAKKVLL